MLIRLLKGHHNFKKDREVFDAKGKSKGKTKLVHPGDSFNATEEEWKGTFHYRAEKTESVVPSVVFDQAVLEKTNLNVLKKTATGMGLEFARKTSKKKMIELIMAEAPKDEPTVEWSEDQLKSFLDEAEITYDEESNLLELALEHFNA